MITKAILYTLCSPVLLLLDLLPSVSVTLPNDIFSSMDSLFSSLGFILPMTTLCIIISSKITLKLAKITIAFVVRIKSFIPTMGA